MERFTVNGYVGLTLTAISILIVSRKYLLTLSEDFQFKHRAELQGPCGRVLDVVIHDEGKTALVWMIRVFKNFHQMKNENDILIH